MALACFAALASIRAPRQATLVEMTPTSARYEGLREDALRFFRAVCNGDKPTLARLAPPRVAMRSAETSMTRRHLWRACS